MNEDLNKPDSIPEAYATASAPDLGLDPEECLAPERSDPNYRDVVLEARLRQAFARLNPDLPADALEDAYRKLTRFDAHRFWSATGPSTGCWWMA